MLIGKLKDKRMDCIYNVYEVEGKIWLCRLDKRTNSKIVDRIGSSRTQIQRLLDSDEFTIIEE